MIIQCYVVFIHVRLALRGTSGLPGKSDLTALMLFESFGCTSVSLFWQLSTISRFSSAFWVFFFEFRRRSVVERQNVQLREKRSHL